jgi:hypothetical protein
LRSCRSAACPGHAFGVVAPAISGTHRELPRLFENGKTDDQTEDDRRKQHQERPDDWVSGDEPMTGAQASYLKTLCEQAHSDAFDENLTKAEASKLIEEMRENAGVSNDETQ